MFYLSLTSLLLLKVIFVFILAIPTGLGLALGFHLMKNWIKKIEDKISSKLYSRDKFCDQIEEMMAGGNTAKAAV